MELWETFIQQCVRQTRDGFGGFGMRSGFQVFISYLYVPSHSFF